MAITALVVLVCSFGIALSLKTVAVLGNSAPWTSAGWWLTVVYLIAVIAKTTVYPYVPGWLEYGVLGGLTVAFVIAGVRDERQADPWWWPLRRGATRAERSRTN